MTTKQEELFDKIAKSSTRSERMSWNRKMNNMVKLLAKLRPIEEEILKLIESKTPILDEIHELRQQMVQECIHPREYLTYHEDGYVLCKFCNKKVNIPDNDEQS